MKTNTMAEEGGVCTNDMRRSNQNTVGQLWIGGGGGITIALLRIKAMISSDMVAVKVKGGRWSLPMKPRPCIALL